MAKKRAVKKATVKPKGTKAGSRKAQNKAAAAALKEYGEKYQVWEAVAHKVLAGSKGVAKDSVGKVQAAKKFMELAGGYEEAFIILDAVMIAATTEEEGK
jgi:hypothetical protein